MIKKAIKSVGILSLMISCLVPMLVEASSVQPRGIYLDEQYTTAYSDEMGIEVDCMSQVYWSGTTYSLAQKSMYITGSETWHRKNIVCNPTTGLVTFDGKFTLIVTTDTVYETHRAK